MQMTDIIQTITQIEEIPQLEQVLKGRRECYYRNIKRMIYFFFLCYQGHRQVRKDFSEEMMMELGFGERWG